MFPRRITDGRLPAISNVGGAALSSSGMSATGAVAFPTFRTLKSFLTEQTVRMWLFLWSSVMLTDDTAVDDAHHSFEPSRAWNGDCMSDAASADGPVTLCHNNNTVRTATCYAGQVGSSRSGSSGSRPVSRTSRPLSRMSVAPTDAPSQHSLHGQIDVYAVLADLNDQTRSNTPTTPPHNLPGTTPP